MHRVHFHAVDAGFLAQAGRFAVGIDDLRDLLLRHFTAGDLVVPAVREHARGSRQVFDVDHGARDAAEDLVGGEHRQGIRQGHGAAEARGHLDEHLGAGLMQLVHELFELFEFRLVLVQPHAAEHVADRRDAGDDQTAIVVGDVLQELCRLLVKVVGFHPTENAGAAHGCQHDPVLDFQVADFPGGE